MIVLGIDPGSSVTGYGIVKMENIDNIHCLDFGCIYLTKIKDFNKRLKTIYDKVINLVESYHPDYLALEDIFYSQNIQSALKLGQARGAAIIAALNTKVSLAVYSPREIKQAITGYGGASKEQVQRMVVNLLNINQDILPLDASDALAAAICHAGRLKTKRCT